MRNSTFLPTTQDGKTVLVEQNPNVHRDTIIQYPEFESFQPRTIHTNDSFESRDYREDELEIVTQAKHSDFGWVTVERIDSSYKTRLFATLKQVEKPMYFDSEPEPNFKELAIELLDASNKMKNYLMDLIMYNVLPDENCADANDLIDEAHKAITKAETELKLK